MIVKTTDGKGRISLGTSFANVPVRVETNGRGEWVIRVVEAVPIQEAWLLKNKEALNLVTAGILSARKQEFVADPRRGRDYSWLDAEDDDVSDKVD